MKDTPLEPRAVTRAPPRACRPLKVLVHSSRGRPTLSGFVGSKNRLGKFTWK